MPLRLRSLLCILLFLFIALIPILSQTSDGSGEKERQSTVNSNSHPPSPLVELNEARDVDPLDTLGARIDRKPGAVANIKIPTSAEVGENWETVLAPGTPGTRIPASMALDTEPAVYPEFTRELLQLQWRPLDAIDLWVVRPAGVKNPPVILYLYSYPSENDRYINTEFCKKLTERGFAAVGFVSNLTGHRYHERPTKEWFVSQLQEALSTTVHDVQFILDYLTDRGDLDMTRVGMWGDGSGASIAIMAAAVDPRIKVLDLINPWGDWPNWMAKSSLIPEAERANYLKPDFLKKVQNLDPVKWVPELRGREVRLQYIDTVNVTPEAAKKTIESAAPANVKVVRYADSTEFFRNVAADGKAFDWIKQQLGSAVVPSRNVASEGLVAPKGTSPGKQGGCLR